MDSSTGEVRPNAKMSASDQLQKQQKIWEDAGYFSLNNSTSWELFYSADFAEALKIQEFDFCANSSVHWWVSKIRPGHCFPMHTDILNSQLVNPRRYWVALDDYQYGHIFLIDDICLQDYKRGDVFLFDNTLHGGINLGSSNKYSLQLLVSD